MSDIIKIISPRHGLVLPGNDGEITIAKLGAIFKYIGPNFFRLNLDKPCRPVEESRIQVGEMVKDADFRDMFYSLACDKDIESLKKLCLTQLQGIDSMIQHHKWLCANGSISFFLTAKKQAKKEKDFFVSEVSCPKDGQRSIVVSEFCDDVVWRADGRLRVFFPHLKA